MTRFIQAMQDAGLTPPSHIEPGKFMRFSGIGKTRSNKAGWCKLFEDESGGVFGDFAQDLKHEWHSTQEGTITEAEKQAFRAKANKAREEAESVREAAYREASDKATALWEAAEPAPVNHGYLIKKGIKPHGAKVDQSGRLLLSISDVQGRIASVQTVSPDGIKRFMADGKKKGGMFIIGVITPNVPLIICEGFSTGASLNEATGYPIAVAFDSGNLGEAARALRAQYPGLTMIVCADDDVLNPKGNTGINAAKLSAKDVSATLSIQKFGADRPSYATDFNDMATLYGLDAIKQAVEAALNEAAQQDQPDDVPASESKRSTIPGIEERPAYRVFEKQKEADGHKHKPGVWFFGVKQPKGDAPPQPTETYICGPLHIEAITHDEQSNNFGRLLRFVNSLGHWRERAMPMSLLKGDGQELRGALLGMGLEIDPHSRQLLSQYVQTQRAKRVITCATQTGWAGSSFVLPDCVIGPSCDAVTYQTGETEHNEHTQAGNLREWKASVSSLAQGNPLIMLAISAAFAGPLLAKVNAESGGIHFVGNSSTGKTTLIETACSIWGGTNYRRSWRATSNGMEGAAALFNDCLLALDEISECDPKDIGAIIYALANGRGKQRSNRSGAARAVTRWRCFVLSTGERTMATAMQDGGQRIKAGQAVRILDIQVNHKHGAFDDLREHTTGAALSDNLKQSSSRYYGTPGRAFLERLTRDERDFSVSLERLKATPLFKSNGGEGQEKRALARFALIALAGELASEYGITGWEEGQAAESASIAYQAWRLERGNGNDERRQIPEQVAEFIERHGDSRFSDADSLRDDVVVRDRAGWWRAEESGGRVYLFTASGLREALKGHDFKQALNALQEAGAIDSTPSGERARFMRINKRGMKLYVIQADKLAGGDHGD